MSKKCMRQISIFNFKFSIINISIFNFKFSIYYGSRI